MFEARGQAEGETEPLSSTASTCRVHQGRLPGGTGTRAGGPGVPAAAPAAVPGAEGGVPRGRAGTPGDRGGNAGAPSQVPVRGTEGGGGAVSQSPSGCTSTSRSLGEETSSVLGGNEGQLLDAATMRPKHLRWGAK